MLGALTPQATLDRRATYSTTLLPPPFRQEATSRIPPTGLTAIKSAVLDVLLEVPFSAFSAVDPVGHYGRGAGLFPGLNYRKISVRPPKKKAPASCEAKYENLLMVYGGVPPQGEMAVPELLSAMFQMSASGYKRTCGSVGDYVRFTPKSRHKWVGRGMSANDTKQTSP